MPDDVQHDVVPSEATPVDPAAENPDFYPGYPLVRFHPIFGRVEFDAPNDYAKAGGDEGEYRFKTAFDADRASTGEEAELRRLHNLQLKLEAHKAVRPVARNSVQAEESRATGYPEPGLS